MILKKHLCIQFAGYVWNHVAIVIRFRFHPTQNGSIRFDLNGSIRFSINGLNETQCTQFRRYDRIRKLFKFRYWCEKKLKIYWQILNKFKWELTNLFENKLLTKNNGYCERLFHWEFIGSFSKICGSFDDTAKYKKWDCFLRRPSRCAQKKTREIGEFRTKSRLK